MHCTNRLGDSRHPVQCFFEKNSRIYSQLVLHCNACLQDSAVTQITTVSIPVSTTSGQDTSALVAGGNVMSNQPSSPSRQYALSGSTHPIEDTETADPSQKPLVIISNFVV